MPPCGSTNTGRQLSNLVASYYKNKEVAPIYTSVDGKIFISSSEGLTLSEFCLVSRYICFTKHNTNKSCSCGSMIQVAEMVQKEGIVKLSTLFRSIVPNVSYRSGHAKRRLLRIPLVVFFINDEQYVMEKLDGLRYDTLIGFLKSTAHQQASGFKQVGLKKNELQDLLSIVKGDKERECIRYAVYKCSGLTATQARKQYGLENMVLRASEVEMCIAEAKDITIELQSLAADQSRALLDCYGLTCNEQQQFELSDESSSDDDELVVDSIEELQRTRFPQSDGQCTIPEDPNLDDSVLLDTLVKSGYNWFEFVELLEQKCNYLPPQVLDEFFSSLPHKKLSEEALQLVIQSHRAYIAATRDMAMEDRDARSINGEIVTESESDLDSTTSSTDVASLVLHKQASIKRRIVRLRSRLLAERRLLQRKITKCTSKLLDRFPNIGEVIEEFVADHNVGADAWRRTGVLTFDGNTNLLNKVTYKGIQEHLKKTYGVDFSYGTVVELCIPRNKRRRSAKRYRGLAKVTTCRARKGFNLRYNPDAHWSAAFYKGLNTIQYEDGRNILNINRDDAAGFRLETLTTCKQYATPHVQDMNVLTTRTDYVNKTPSLLQTTSYNFTKTKTTSEVCVGVVKAVPIHQKNPVQHYSDLLMLANEPLLKPVFCNLENDTVKSIDCIRVDGASDEGPSHEVVQYFWTDWHFTQGKLATLLTTRSSGSSYLNRVELQNGCLSLGHANTFIPSTLGGTCIDQETGKVDEAKLKHNLPSLAINAYISRVDGCPCGETKIHLFQGSDFSSIYCTYSDIEIFLKGSKKAKAQFRSQDPLLYTRFETVWEIRNRHMVLGLPQSYIFFLKCCFQNDCPHPVCRKECNGDSSTLTWYPDGPPISTIPLVSIDPERPYGSSTCPDHKGFCTGHYRSVLVDVNDKAALKASAIPPSSSLKHIFASKTELGNEYAVEKAAKVNLLSPDEVNIWFDHLNTVLRNRKKGAAKAAVTRKHKRAKGATITEPSTSTTSSPPVVMTTTVGSSLVSTPAVVVTKDSQEQLYHCAKCGLEYSDSTALFWIACDMCNEWYCSSCEGLLSEPHAAIYSCKKCSN